MAAERVSEPGQVAGQGVSGTVRQFVGPDPFDQLVGRHKTVHVDQQCHKDAALTGRTDVEHLPARTRLHVAE